jgi:hypothetical protein
MDRPDRRLVVSLVIAVVAIVPVACSAVPPPSTGPSPSVSAAPSPTLGPSTSAAPSAAGACPVETQTGRLPSDRLTDVVIGTSGGFDTVTFVFGEPSLAVPPQGESEGLLEAAEPPFVEGASGLPMEIEGEHVVFVRFSGMSLVDDVGEPTYDGETEFHPDGAALLTVVNSEEFEGVSGWYIGYDGPGCVTLTSDPRRVIVAIEQPAA